MIVGAINWGLVGAFNFDLVQVLFGSWPIVVRVVYIVIGVAGVLCLLWLLKGKKGSSGSSCCASPPQGGTM